MKRMYLGEWAKPKHTFMYTLCQSLSRSQIYILKCNCNYFSNSYDGNKQRRKNLRNNYIFYVHNSFSNTNITAYFYADVIMYVSWLKKYAYYNARERDLLRKCMLILFWDVSLSRKWKRESVAVSPTYPGIATAKYIM